MYPTRYRRLFEGKPLSEYRARFWQKLTTNGLVIRSLSMRYAGASWMSDELNDLATKGNGYLSHLEVCDGVLHLITGRTDSIKEMSLLRHRAIDDRTNPSLFSSF